MVVQAFVIPGRPGLWAAVLGRRPLGRDPDQIWNSARTSTAPGAEKLLMESRLDALASQSNPHFLSTP